MLDLKIKELTHPGKQKTADWDNQDAKWVNNSRNLLIVSDGVGGCDSGELASKLAVISLRQDLNFFAKNLKKGLVDGEDILPYLEGTINNAHYRLASHYDSQQLGENLAATADVCLFDPLNGKLYGAHVGDGRVYLFNPKDGLRRLTEDHSSVQPTDGRTKIFESDVRLTKALGMRRLPEGQNALEPDLYAVDVKPGDTILVATDGLTDLVSEREMCAALKKFGWKGYNVTRELVKRANEPRDIARLYAGYKGITLAEAREKIGGRDNITLIAAKVYWR